MLLAFALAALILVLLSLVNLILRFPYLEIYIDTGFMLLNMIGVAIGLNSIIQAQKMRNDKTFAGFYKMTMFSGLICFVVNIYALLL